MERSPKTDFAASSTQSQSTNSVVESVFRDRKLYGIEDLFHVWESGAGKLAELAFEIYTPRYKGSADIRACPTKRVKDCLAETLGSAISTLCPTWPDQISPGYSVLELLGLASAPDGKYEFTSVHKYIPNDRDSGGSVQDDTKLKKTLQKVTKAVTESETLQAVLEEISSKKNYVSFIKNFEEYNSDKELENYLACKIELYLIKIMSYLGVGLRNKDACEEAWWNCVRIVIEPLIQDLLEIHEQIKADLPLTENQITLLNHYTNYGSPSGGWIMWENGSQTYEIALLPNCHQIEAYPLSMAALTLLVQPAYALARKLEQKHSKPRFIRKCRAPSCGKMFYTGQKDRNACSNGYSDSKSDCALEVVRYRRWLKKTGKNPERDWDNKQLQQEFISHYEN